MKPEIIDYIEREIQSYYVERLESLNKLNIDNLIKKKNPYLFRIKNLNTSEIIVTELVNAHLSSSEETMFGNWMEKFAIYTCKIYRPNSGAQKASSFGADLDFKINDVRYIISIKSGPNWGNSEQIKKLEDRFKSIRMTLRTSGNSEKIEFINGCIYGDKNKVYSDYSKVCGEKFWELLTSDSEFYKKIIIPLGEISKIKDEEYKNKLSARINILTSEFTSNYCYPDGVINWDMIIERNSSALPGKKSMWAKKGTD